MASAVYAIPVSGLVCEGGVSPAATSGCPGGIVLNDFNENIGNPYLELIGDTHIWGGVAHRTDTLYTDKWTMDFGTSVYQAVFSWNPKHDSLPNFDAELIIDGTTSYAFSTVTDPNGGSFIISGLTGVMTFDLDPRLGIFGPNPDEVAEWDMKLTAVPLPAGMVLLISGLGGLGLMRKRKT